MDLFLAYLAGLLTAATALLAYDIRNRLAVYRDLVKVKEDFTDTVSKAASANNLLVEQLAQVGDRVQVLEMFIRTGEKK